MNGPAEPLKILLYNFAQPNEGEGGGVSVYQRNLARVLVSLGHTVIMLSSGMRYTLPGSRAFLRRLEGGAYLCADVVNSPVVAPASASFYELDIYNDSQDLDHLPGLLRAEFGEIDVFHFQNLEGLTRRSFSAIRDAFPAARLLYSVHNYNLVCPQVHLWFQDRELCLDYREGHDCTRCPIGFARRPHHQTTRPIEAAMIRRLGLPRTHFAVRATRRAIRTAVQTTEKTLERGRQLMGTPKLRAPDAAVYRDFRHGNVALCNQVFDRLLAVSKRTGDLLAHYGVDTSQIAVSYIGTAHKQTFLKAKRIESFKTLHLGYLGYARRDKGFFFLLDALESLPASVASRIELTIAASVMGDAKTMARIDALRSRLSAVVYHDGFTHATLDRVIAPVNLGIVPVLWEDNLPQVAIEMVSRGIPILTSDRGGAGEIAGNSDFSFKAGDMASLHERLRAIVDGDLSLGEFWKQPLRIFSMEEHVADLMHYYSPAPNC
ncbi:MAG: glycosyltransferase [Janthinobacterium lividum]